MNQEPKISEVNVIPIKPKDGLIAFASFVIDDKYYVGSVAIFTRLAGDGYRLVYPTKKVGEKNINMFHPITPEAGKIIEDVITEKVSELFKKVFNESTTSPQK